MSGASDTGDGVHEGPGNLLEHLEQIDGLVARRGFLEEFCQLYREAAPAARPASGRGPDGRSSGPAER